MIKDKVLELLREKREEFVSGQEICKKLGVSRTAIWKAVRSLKEDGYIIESVTNRGHCLSDSMDVLNASELQRELENEGVNIPYFFEKKVDSTNQWAKELALKVKNEKENNKEYIYQNALCVTDEQTNGRGRKNRIWISPTGTGVWMSLMLRPNVPPRNAHMLIPMLAMATSKAIQEITEVKTGIKWPNDLVYQGKKVCGILTTSSVDMDYIHHVVCGIGINVNMTTFPTELEDIAISLRMITGKTYIRAKLIARIVKNIYEYLKKLENTGSLVFIKEEYEERLVSKEKDVYIMESGTSYRAYCKGITDRGGLLVLQGDKEVEVVMESEVSVRGVYGYV